MTDKKSPHDLVRLWFSWEYHKDFLLLEKDLKRGYNLTIYRGEASNTNRAYVDVRFSLVGQVRHYIDVTVMSRVAKCEVTEIPRGSNKRPSSVPRLKARRLTRRDPRR